MCIGEEHLTWGRNVKFKNNVAKDYQTEFKSAYQGQSLQSFNLYKTM